MIAVILPYLKKFWWISIVVIVLIYSNIRINNLQETILQNQQSHQREIQIINSSNEQLRSEQAMFFEEFQKKSTLIDEEYQSNLQKLQFQKNQNLLLIKQDFEKRKFEEISKRIVDQYGFIYVPTNNH